ncbi:MAG: TonB-dependent receptor [Gemmatimonadota bacterium]
MPASRSQTGWQSLVRLTTLLTLAARTAQAQNGALVGRLLADDGHPVSAASVVLRSLRPSPASRYATSDETGAFRFGFVPAGTYHLAAYRIGFRPAVVDSVVITDGAAQAITLRMTQVAFGLESLVVAAPEIRIDKNDTELGRRLGPRELSQLPLPNDVRDAIAFLPGVRPDQVWGAATAQANAYRINGLGVNHPGVGGDLIQLSPHWLERIEVRGLGTGAESGDFQGGLIDYVTKSGGNRLQGELRLTGQSPSLNGSNLDVTGVGTEPAHRRDIDGYVGGPIVRDRLFYAGFAQWLTRDYQVLNRLRQIPGTFSPRVPEEDARKLLGTLTWKPNANSSVNLMVGHFRADVDRLGLDGFASPEATLQGRQRTTLYQVDWQRNWSAAAWTEVRLGGYTSSDRRDPYAGTGVPGIATIATVTPRLYQNAPMSELRKPSSRSAGVSTDWLFRLGGLGHHLKAGAEYSGGSWRFERHRNGGVTWRPGDRISPNGFDPTVPSTWVFSGVITSTWGGEINLDSGVENTALYLQDNIQLLPRLGLNLGARWGHWVGRIAPAGSTDRFTALTDAALEPRIGAILDLNGRGTFVLKAHWGRYHQGMFASLFDRVAGTNVFSNEERWEYTGQPFADPRTVFTIPERGALAQAGLFHLVESIRLNETGKVVNYKQPYVEQGVLGVERTLGAHWKAAAVGVHRRNKNMVALVDRNIDRNYTVYTDVRVLDRFGRPVSFGGKDLILPKVAVSNEDILYWLRLIQAGLVTGPEYLPPVLTPQQLGQLTYDPDFVLTNVPQANRRFDQLQLSIEARYPRWWASASGTFTRLKGNLNSITGNDDYSTSGAGPFVRLNEQFNFDGFLNNQSDIELKGQVGGRLWAGLDAGLAVAFFTGDRVTPTLTLSNLLYEFDLPKLDSVRGEPQRLRSIFFQTTAGQRILLEPRGTFRYASRTSVDLHLQRGFRVGRSELVATADGFNILGSSSTTEIQTSLNGEFDGDPDSKYRAVRNRVPPRTVRLGAYWRF